MKNIHIINICIVLCISYICGGCVAKSSAVKENSQHITDTLIILNKHFPEDKDVVQLYNQAVETEQKGAALFNKQGLVAAVKMGAKVVSKSTGWPIEGIVGGVIALVVGAERLMSNKKQRKKLKLVGELEPKEASKVTDVL